MKLQAIGAAVILALILAYAVNNKKSDTASQTYTETMAVEQMPQAPHEAVAIEPREQQAHSEQKQRKPRPMREDTNKDGKVSIQESVAAAERRFKKVDTNNDGFITSEEVKASREKARKEQKSKKKQPQKQQ